MQSYMELFINFLYQSQAAPPKVGQADIFGNTRNSEYHKVESILSNENGCASQAYFSVRLMAEQFDFSLRKPLSRLKGDQCDVLRCNEFIEVSSPK